MCNVIYVLSLDDMSRETLLKPSQRLLVNFVQLTNNSGNIFKTFQLIKSVILTINLFIRYSKFLESEPRKFNEVLIKFLQNLKKLNLTETEINKFEGQCTLVRKDSFR